MDRHQEDLKAWKAWKQNPNPQTLRVIMDRVKPIAKYEANKYKQTGMTPMLLDNKAEEIAYESLHTYDPNRGQLNTHIITNMQRLNRYAIEKQNSVRVQEKQVFDYRRFLQEKHDLEEELGRPATEQELMSKLGTGRKLKDMKPIVEHYYSMNVEGGGKAPVRQDLAMDAVTLAMLHQDLKPPQREVFEYTYGYGGKPRLQKQQIAKKLNISNSMVSKHSRAIESKYRQYDMVTGRVLGA